MKNETARKQPAQHTPWRIDPHSGYDLRTDGQVVDAEGMQVLSYGRLVHCISPEHANTIVTAVNSHDSLLASHTAYMALLEVLNEELPEIEALGDGWLNHPATESVKAIRKVMAQAKQVPHA